MTRSIRSVRSLLLSVTLLLFGHGIHLTLLPLIADGYQWSASLNAATTSAYFLGFGAGCLIVPRWLRLIGHARAFTVLVATTTGALLALLLLPWAIAWLPLRAIYGIGISGIYITVESWINDATAHEYRGKVLAIYAAVTLLAIFGAQMLLQVLDMDHQRLLVLAAIFIVIAALPIGLTRRPMPKLNESPRLRLGSVLQPANRPAMAAGILTGTFWALAPVYVTRLGFPDEVVARYMAATVGAGMLAVYPLGFLSDRIGRARVIGALALIGIVATSVFIGFVPPSQTTLLMYGFGFGAVVMPLYALCLALANDMAVDTDFVTTGSTVIMAHATGMVIGPLLAGYALTGREPVTLAWFWIAGFAVLALTSVGTLRHASPAPQDGAAFELVPRSVPEALNIDPRAGNAEPEIEAGVS